VQPGDGRLEPVPETRVAVDPVDLLRQLGWEELVALDVDAVAGPAQDVVGESLASVVERDVNLTVDLGRLRDDAPSRQRDVREPLDEPPRPGRSMCRQSPTSDISLLMPSGPTSVGP
jgi:hypothetical protein